MPWAGDRSTLETEMARSRSAVVVERDVTKRLCTAIISNDKCPKMPLDAATLAYLSEPLKEPPQTPAPCSLLPGPTGAN